MLETHVQSLALLEWQGYLQYPIDWEPLQHAAGYKSLSFVRYAPTWMKAELYPQLSHHPALASYLLLLKSSDWQRTLAIYPVSSLGANAALLVDTYDADFAVKVNVRRVRPGRDERLYVVCAEAEGVHDERSIIGTVVEKARELVGGRTPSWVGARYFHGLGICTWESLGGSTQTAERCTRSNLLPLVPSYPITHFLIDDGWHDTRDHHPRPDGPSKGRLHSFHAWSGMGCDMATVVSEIKAKARPISGEMQVGVWVTMQGYWYGLDPESAVMQKYDLQRHVTARTGQTRGGVRQLEGSEGEWQYLPSPDKAEDFWLDWFGAMKLWGVDFVKCDNQAHWDGCVGDAYQHAQQAIWSGMLSAAEKIWGSTNRIIMCMSHNERMLTGPGGLDFDRPAGPLVFRNSDDYNLPMPNRHSSFILWNAYNSILTSHLSLIPDYDMFASAPGDHLPVYHAFFRCMSASPLFLSDPADIATDLDLLGRMTATTKSGELVAVQAEQPARVGCRRWFWDNIHGQGGGPGLLAGVRIGTAGAILGLWNCQREEGSGVALDRVTWEDLEDVLHEEGLDAEYVVYTMGLVGGASIWRLFSCDSKADGLDMRLERDQVEGFIVSRVWQVGERRIAVLGMLDKFAALAGVAVSRVGSSLLVTASYTTSKLGLLVLGEDRPSVSVSVDGQAVEPGISRCGEGWLATISVTAHGEPLQQQGTRDRDGDLWAISMAFQ